MAPPRPIARRFLLSREQCHGGQSVVQFARDVHDSLMQYAVKVFIHPAAFEEEVAQYRDPVLQRCLPALLYATDNSEGAFRSYDGSFAIPPFLVVERGLSMQDWASAVRRPMEVLGLVESVARLLQILHEQGRVHRDIKPDNLLFLTTSAEWRLMDMGICAKAGDVSWPHCTPVYAPPEIVCAVWRDERVEVHPSHDTWSLGVVAYEAVTGKRALASQSHAIACANGAPYPWEESSETQSVLWRRSRVRAIVDPCLRRNAAARPSIASVHAAVNCMVQATE